MAQFEKRRQFQKILYSRVSVAVLMIIVIFLGFSVFSVFQKRHEAFVNEQTAARELKTLSDRQTQTNEEIAKLNTDAGVEEVIRDKYRAEKDGEGLVVIVAKDDSTAENAGQTPQSISIWQRILNFFGI